MNLESEELKETPSQICFYNFATIISSPSFKILVEFLLKNTSQNQPTVFSLIPTNIDFILSIAWGVVGVTRFPADCKSSQKSDCISQNLKKTGKKLRLRFFRSHKLIVFFIRNTQKILFSLQFFTKICRSFNIT